jgi:DNA-directed RNA polymerase subunit RPC12/RpoP
MICQKCKKDFDKLIPLLTYFADGKPIFRYYCAPCEKERWEAMKKYLLDT